MEAQQELGGLLDKIFADGVVDAAERTQLADFLQASGLTAEAVQEAFVDFVRKTWGEAVEDGVVTDDECARLGGIVDALELSRDALPAHVRVLLD